MRTFDFAPLYRTTVGFDRLFDMVDNSGRPDWPPYNIEKKNENEYRISMAIAGFGTEDIELTQNGPELSSSARRSSKNTTARFCTKVSPFGTSSIRSSWPIM